MELVEELKSLEGVKSVRKRNSELRIDLFTEDIGDLSKIKGDLSRITPKIRNVLEEHLDQWEWIVRPEKKYSETEIGAVTDRKPKGYDPDYYAVSLE